MKTIRRAAALLAVLGGLAASLGLLISAYDLKTGNAQFHVSVVTERGSPVAETAKPQKADNPDNAEAKKFYRQVWQAAKDNFLWQDRLADWSQWETRFDGKLQNQDQAEAAVAEMLASLTDKYTCFKDAATTEALNKLTDKRDVVDAQLMANRLGYIRIRTFSSKHTAVEVEDALRQLRNAEGFVIDLRDNTGGYIEEAFKVFAMLVESGELATVKGIHQGRPYTEQFVVTVKALHDIENGSTVVLSRPEYLAGRKPIVVLVNGKTASAAEMLAGALQKRGHKLVGATTFGKGIAQIVLTLGNKTSVQFTFGEYFLPGGQAVNGKGVMPDSSVQAGSSGDTQLDFARKNLESQLPAAKTAASP